MKKFNKKFLDNFLLSYKDNLENLFGYKEYDEISKSMLFQIIAKIKIGYKDLKIVKQEEISFNNYIENLIYILQNKVNKIKIVDSNKKEFSFLKSMEYFIDYPNKTIISIQKESSLLRAIFEIGANDKIYLEDNILNIGFNELVKSGAIQNKIEPLIDFTGYNWTIYSNEIKFKIGSIIYQILCQLCSYSFFEKLIFIKNNQKNIDSQIRQMLYNQYPQILVDNFLDKIYKIGILYGIYLNKLNYINIYNSYYFAKEQFEIASKTDNFFKIQSQRYNMLNKTKQENLALLNQNNLYQNYLEFCKMNNLGPTKYGYIGYQRQIATNIENIDKELYEISMLSNPSFYISYIENLKQKVLTYEVVLSNDLANQMYEIFYDLLKIYLKMVGNKIIKIDTIRLLNQMITEFRYFCKLKLNDNTKNSLDDNCILNSKELNIQIYGVISKLYKKARAMNRMNYFSNNDEICFNIFSKAFELYVIDLEKIYVKLKKDVVDEKTYLQAIFYEEEQIILKDNICLLPQNFKKLDLRLNKKLKLFF